MITCHRLDMYDHTARHVCGKMLGPRSSHALHDRTKIHRQIVCTNVLVPTSSDLLN